MLTTNFASGFSSNFEVTKPETVYPPFSQVIVFNTATSGTRIKLPNYVNSVRIYAWGAGGAGGGKGPGLIRAAQFPGTADARPGGLGGHGGFVQGDFPIPPGEILYVRVGGGGQSPGLPEHGGDGGGYSSVELPSSYLNKHLVVAGGGGGGGRAPTLTNLTPSPTYPTGLYEAGDPGGPAFQDGTTLRFLPLSGKGATISSGGKGGEQPIGAVPVPSLGPYLGPIYGPLPPSEGPSIKSESGTFLRGGGNLGGGINGGGRGNSQTIPAPGWGLPPSPPAVPLGSTFHPTTINSSFDAGGGGGGYYGGGKGHPTINMVSYSSFGGPGGGGGSSYINPTGTNTVMANTAPYAPNPIYTAYFVAKPASSNTKANTATGGLGYVESARFPAPAPFGGFYISGTNWLGQAGGDGLVVIVY